MDTAAKTDPVVVQKDASAELSDLFRACQSAGVTRFEGQSTPLGDLDIHLHDPGLLERLIMMVLAFFKDIAFELALMIRDVVYKLAPAINAKYGTGLSPQT